MITEDSLFETGDGTRIWQKYCGFLDLSLPEFMEIQHRLLSEQIDQINGSPLARLFMPTKPRSAADFRQMVPLTTYDDYAFYFDEKNEDVLAVKPYRWARTWGSSGNPKWIPYTEKAVDRLGMYGISALVLAATSAKGKVNIHSGSRILLNMPPAPYMLGILAQVMAHKLNARVMTPADRYRPTALVAGIHNRWHSGLGANLDILASSASVLAEMGRQFAEGDNHLPFNWRQLHPRFLRRILRARLRCYREHRRLLPQDLWPVKGLVSYGMDTDIYRPRIMSYWGQPPLVSYATTEARMLALNAWNKKHLTFVPASSFLEFIPEEGRRQGRANKQQPPTVLPDEVVPGKIYELVTTSFHGMPLLRYRAGDLIRVISLGDEETGIRLPQIVFYSRVDSLIEIAGIAYLDEKTIWQALINAGIKYRGWSARREQTENDQVIRLYIELREDKDKATVEQLIHHELAAQNKDYGDLSQRCGSFPLQVVLLPAGSFRRYYEKQRKSGADPAQFEPPHTNAADPVINSLTRGTNAPYYQQ